ncbi:MAG: 4Fe-4S dicluster domain-containing protein [Synergistaceae bacterium]|jgi:ferredoxin|nr:4Fe-4S dicluster domain-containing protein [Synergistaceae bacterium]
MMLKLSKDKIGELFQKIASDRTLYLPVDNNGQVNFGRWTPDAAVRLDQLKTVKSSKDFFFPQTENIVAFKRQGKDISIIEKRDANEPFVVFGVRGCDVRSLDILDRVFLCDPVDSFYKARRENGTIVSFACSEPEENCFCGVFGIDAADPLGDATIRVIGGDLYWDAKTDKGRALEESAGALFTQATALDSDAIKEHDERSREISGRLPLKDLDLDSFEESALLEKFNSPLWKELSQACVGCGTCTYVCPTCQCYDIQDFDTGHGIQRFRCWDSCMYSDFTLMAHGNNRKSQVERFRQRFMHKLIYYPANNDGIFSCVGCGRCVAKCPISMNIAKVIRALGGVSVSV